MAITLGTVTFDETYTQVKEKLEEVGGRNERSIVLSGLIVGEETVSDIHDRLDEILEASSQEAYSAELSVRGNRHFYVRRNGFSREVRPESLTGSFELELLAKQPYEESNFSMGTEWDVTSSGETKFLVPGGSVYAKTQLYVRATVNDIVNPTFSDGVRTIQYQGSLQIGQILFFDGFTDSVTLDGGDVMGYTTGLFPRLEPTGTTLTYTDDVTSSHTSMLDVYYIARWW